MKTFLLLMLSLAGVLSLYGCGGTSTSQLQPPPVTVSLSPSALALDVNQSAPITAIVNNDPGNQGFDWTLACGGGNCGAITRHTASGAPATYTAPGAVPSNSVTVTATVTGLANPNMIPVTVSPPPTVATTGTITAATLGSPYSFQLAAKGGAGTLTWASAGGTSLPDTLALSQTGMITGTPNGASSNFNFKVHVTDSANPPMTSPDVQLSIAVGPPAISIGLLPTSANVALKGSTQFVATAANDLQSGNIDWTLTLNDVACTIAECGSVSPITTASGSPTTYTPPPSIPAAAITLTATTVDGNPPASASATINITAHGFVSTGRMGTARESHTATLLDFGSVTTNGKVLIAGGIGDNKQAVSSAEIFDPSTQAFAPIKESMTMARAFHTATLLKNGTVLITGGLDQNGASLDTAELYDPSSGTFTSTRGNMATSRAYHTATLLIDGTVLLTGGIGASSGTVTAELFNPAAGGSFTPTNGNMLTARTYHTATLLDHGSALTNGKVLIAGGAQAFPELFDPSSGNFISTGGQEFAVTHHSATLLNDGRVLLTGGGGYSSNPNSGASTTAEIFDPNTGIITATGGMTAKRANHKAVLLTDDTVLATGGYYTFAYTSHGTIIFAYLLTAETYDPASRVSSATGSMTGPRAYHTITILKDGTVLVTGGDDGSGPLATAELYQ